MPGCYVISLPIACVSILRTHERVSAAVATLLLLRHESIGPFWFWNIIVV
jgi:hypothetical protein